jgi:hypothetical protein
LWENTLRVFAPKARSCLPILIFFFLSSSLAVLFTLINSNFAFSQASTKALRGPNGALLSLHLTYIDYCERVPIHLLGKPTLLNKQPGGFFASFAPPRKDANLFQKFQTGVFKNLSSSENGKIPNGPDKFNISALMYQYYEFVRNHALQQPTGPPSSRPRGSTAGPTLAQL